MTNTNVDFLTTLAELKNGKAAIDCAELDDMLNDAKVGRKIRRSVTLIEPTNQTKDYDRVISMLEMSVDDVINLEEHDFRQYILDEWNWQKQWDLSNRGYSASLMAKSYSNTPEY